MLSEFVQAVASTCTNADALAEAPPERGKHSLFFDFHGPIDLLGPEEVDSLLADLATSDSPVSALEALSSDVHLLEDLCFGPTWPQLCDALGRLVCLPAAAPVAAGGGPLLGQPAAPPLPRQQHLLLSVLQELVTSVAASSPPHAAELLDALAPHLTAMVLRLTALPPAPPVPAAAAPPAPPHGAGGLLAAAAAADPFAVGLMRIAQRLLGALAAEFHMQPPGCAALAARAVCDVVRAGLARGAPAPPTVPAATAAAKEEEAPTVAAADLGLDLDLSALDLLVLLDPELRWWQRLCASTHATQRLADAAAATHLAAALEAALQAWAAAAASSSSTSHGGGGGGGGGAACTAARGGRSPTHLLACTALLGGLVRANNPALLGCDSKSGGGGGAGGGSGGGGSREGSRTAAPAQQTPQQYQGRPVAAAVAAAAAQQQRVRLQRMLGHLLSCFCLASDKPWLFRPYAYGGSAAKASAAGTDAGGSNGKGCGSSHGGGGGGRGSVFLLLAADALAAAAALGKLLLLAAAGSGAVGQGTGSGALTPLLQAMLRAAAVTASGGGSAAVQGSCGMTDTAAALAEAEVWLAAAARVLDAATDHVTVGHSETAAAAAAAAAADAMCVLLRHVAGRVRGCAAAAPATAPAWATSVLRAAVALSVAAPAVATALQDLYDTVHAVLSSRAPPSRRRPLKSTSSSPTDGGCGRGTGSGGGAAAEPSRVSLIDILDSGGALAPEQSRGSAASPSASLEFHAAAVPNPNPDLDTQYLDDLELLAAAAVMSYCRTIVCGGGGGGAAAPAMLLQPPAALRRPLYLECAARLLCEEYDAAGGGGSLTSPGGGAPRNGGGAGGLCARRAAAKRRVAWRAEALARCCLAGQQALVAAGFARRVLDDVAVVLRSGEYESPYLDPLPYADPLAGLGAVLCGVLCWPGLLRVPEEGEGEGPREDAAAGGLGSALERRHRREVLALLQELVTWLDPRGAEGGGLPPADAAAVSLRGFAALVASDSSAGAALERDTNIRWYLLNLCGTLPAEGEGESERRDAASGGGRKGGADEPPPPPQSDMLLDLAQAVLQAMAPRGANAGTA